MDLNSLFDEKADETQERAPLPWVPYLKKDSKEHLAIRFLEDLAEMQKYLDVSHYVEGVGHVKCAKKPIVNRETGKIFLWNGYSNKQGKMLEPQHDCVFCKEKYAAADALKAREAAGEKVPKEEGTKVNQLHNLSRQLNAKVLWRLQERKGKQISAVSEWTQGFLRLRITDLFSENGKGFYKQLSEAQNDEILMDYLWILKPGSVVLEKDAVVDGDLPEDELDRSVILGMVKEYEVGSKMYLDKKNRANSGARQSTVTEQTTAQNTAVTGADIADDDLPF